MITVPEAARRVGRDAETVRRWIRTGRLRATKVGTQHVVDEADLEALVADVQLPLPPEWERLPDGRPMPNVIRAIRLARTGR